MNEDKTLEEQLLQNEDKRHLRNLLKSLSNPHIGVEGKVWNCLNYLRTEKIRQIDIDRFMNKDYKWPPNINKNDKMLTSIKAILVLYDNLYLN